MNTLHRLAATAALLIACTAAQAASVNVDVTGVKSINLLGETGNTVRWVNVGAGMQLGTLNWAVTLNAFAPSLLSEMQVSFGSSSGLDQVTLAPATGADFSGTQAYAGALDLTPYAITSGPDGLLRIEFSESYKDAAFGTADGQWVSGNLTLNLSAVPEPASALLAALGLGLVGWQASRARRASL